MDIEAIRNAFCKGGIAISQNGVTAFYNYKERWLAQSFFDKSYDIFKKLLKSCEEFRISYVKGRVFKLEFINNINGQAIILFPPISPEISIEELEEILNDIPDRLNEDLIEFFIGVDLDDDDEVLDAFREFLRYEENNKDKVIFLPLILRWKSIVDKGVEFADMCGFSLDIDNSDGVDCFGSITLILPEETHSTILVGKSKKLFEEIIDLSSGIDLELNIAEGFLYLTFYV